MDELDTEEFKDAVRSIASYAEAMGRVNLNRGKGNTESNPAADFKGLRQQLNSINSSLKLASNSFATLAGDAASFSNSLKGILRGGFLSLIGGEIIADIVEAGEKVFHTYRELSEVGQNFGGSMLNMAKAAADANLPLDEFATMIKRNSVVAAQLSDQYGRGSMSLGSLNREVQNNLKQFGFFGMSLQDVSDITGDYADTMRLSNSAAYKNKKAMSDQISQFATDIAEWSAATGADRKKLSEDANELLRNVSLNSVNLTDQTRKAVESFSVGMAALPGGKEIAGGINDIIAAKAEGLSAANTEFGQSLIKAGGEKLLDTYDAVAGKLLNGQKLTASEQMDLIDQGNEFITKNGAYLDTLARSGNADARKLQEILVKGRGYDKKTMLEKMEQAKKLGALTSVFSDLEDAFTEVSSTFKTSLLQSLGLMDNSENPQMVKDAQEKMKSMFASISTFAGQLGTVAGGSIKDLVKNLPTIAKGIQDFIKDLSIFIPAFSTAVSGVIHIFNMIVDGLGTVHNTILGWFGGDAKAGPIGRGVALFGTALATWGTLMAGKALIGGFLNLPSMIGRLLFGRKVDIQANVVNVNSSGSKGILGDIMDNLGGGKGKGAKGAIGAAEEAVEDVAGHKGWFGRIGSALKNSKVGSSLLNMGESYMGEKSGSTVTGGLMKGASWLGSAAKGMFSSNGLFSGVGSAVKGLVKGGISGISNIASTVGGAAKGLLGTLVKKAFGPVLGVAIAASQYLPQIWEAYNLYKSGKLSGKDLATILLNTVGPIALSAGAGFLGEAAVAAGSVLGPLGTVAGVGAAVGIGVGAEKANKALFDNKKVQDLLDKANGKSAPLPNNSIDEIMRHSRSAVLQDARIESGKRLEQALGRKDDFAISQLSPDTLEARMPAVPTDPTKLQTQFQEALDKEPELEKKVKDSENDPKEHTRLLKELNDNIMKLVAIQTQANAQSINLQKKQISTIKQQN